MVRAMDLVRVSYFHRLDVNWAEGGILPLSKPVTGRDSPDGGWNLNSFPDGVTRESVIGLNSIEPANVIAVVNSGLVKKFIVPGFPSFRALHVNHVECPRTESFC